MGPAQGAHSKPAANPISQAESVGGKRRASPCRRSPSHNQERDTQEPKRLDSRASAETASNARAR
ncbi:hypothetical protein D9M72_474760 [compost metagenome]